MLPRIPQRLANAPGAGPAPSPTPPPPPGPPPAVQQHHFVPPPPPFQPWQVGAYHPVPRDNGQYHGIGGLNVNAPPVYAQPYGVQPYGMQPYGVQPYGMQPYGVQPYELFGVSLNSSEQLRTPTAVTDAPPHFATYPGVGNAPLQPWGYGHYGPFGQLPNPVPRPVAAEPEERGRAQDRAAVAPGVGAARRDPRTVTVQQKKTYPNEEVSKGVWQFRVEVDRGQIKQTFAAQTDLTWPEFEAKALEQFNGHEDVRLGYQVSGGNRTWVSLTCPSDWRVAVANVQEKALVARTRAVAMEIKDMNTLNRPKARAGRGKGKEKRCREDDIPPEATPEAQRQDEHLLRLQRHLLCNECTQSSGLRTYCWIEPAREGVKGGHVEIEHREMTHWAKLIEIKKAVVHLRPNIKPYDRPPAKKPKGAHAAPEVHIALNITPTSGVGASQSSYVVSGAQVSQQGSGSGPMHAIRVSDVAVCTEAPASAPTEERSAYTSLDLLADCVVQGRVPLVYEILSLMDIEEPVPNLTYLDSHTDLDNFGYNDAIQLFGLDECLLSGFGLGTENTRRVHQFIQDRFLEPLGLMVTGACEPPSTAEVAAPTAPTVQDPVQRDNGVSSA
ncbi:hypothetical protein EDB84DRAFT_1564538 [Lactarius hengduanensis]|nr:hypothetical protein EDB84DRAFT_1564538 [Lactarius hengduanensis]